MNTHTLHTSSNPPARQNSVSANGKAQILRRWSVAELIAAAEWPRVLASALLPPTAAQS
jgi:hypothetical protein